eukprot:scaffold4372_cov397-Prasinococcus_capsulatus_cf.AAC.21
MAGEGWARKDVAERCQSYIVTYDISELLTPLLMKTIETKPPEPIQYILDLLQLEDAAQATQDADGLSIYRQAQLTNGAASATEPAHRTQDKTGIVELKEARPHLERLGGVAHHTVDDFVSKQEFFTYVAKATKTSTNAEFDEMVRSFATRANR